MDTQKRDESRERRREEALARRMGEALDQLSPRDAGDCPDADLLAAYHEKALPADEIAQWESHFAVCSRCRKILAVLRASADAPLAEKEVAHLGELIAAAQTVAPTRPNRLAWRSHWLAPALGVAAVLAVWFAMRPPWRTADQNPSRTLIAQVPKSEPPAVTELSAADQLSKAAPQKSSEADAVTLKDRSLASTRSLNSPAEVPAKRRAENGNAVGGLAPNTRVAESALQDEKKEQTKSNGAAAGGAAGGAFGMPAAVPPPPAPPASVARTPERLPQAQAKAQIKASEQTPQVTAPPPATTQSVTITAAAPLVETTNSTAGGAVDNARKAADAPLNGRNYQELSKLDATGEIAVQVKTASGTAFWRAGKGGNIQRSTDAGRIWILQASPLQEDWLAGAAISDQVCWLVGRNGAIARTTDGEHWERIASPPVAFTSGKMPDWSGVTARDAQNATISASDGRRYTTQDGGKTWRAQ